MPIVIEFNCIIKYLPYLGQHFRIFSFSGKRAISCDFVIFRYDNLQNKIIDTVDNFLILSEDEILKLIGTIATKKSNPAAHQLDFGKMQQSEVESVRDYIGETKTFFHFNICFSPISLLSKMGSLVS